MRDIIVSDDLCRSLAEGGDDIRFVTAAGEVLGHFEPELTSLEMAEIRRRLASQEPRYTTRQVLERLDSAPRP